MSIKITEKENYLRCLHGERPYWVPSYSSGPMPGAKRPCTSAIFQPPFINSYRRGANDGKDVWGVKYGRPKRGWTTCSTRASTAKTAA